MTLSTCSLCKNATDGVCLLGQSYIDVHQSVQDLTNPQLREQVARSLAPCSFWEESDLAKQISRQVTLSQHAWTRIAYIKLQEADRETFAGLIDVALGVVHQQAVGGVPALDPEPSAPLATQSPVPEVAAELPTDADPASAPEAEVSDDSGDLEDGISGEGTADNPVEQAMQELWLAAASRNSTELAWGRGSGRVSQGVDGVNHLAHPPLPGIA